MAINAPVPGYAISTDECMDATGIKCVTLLLGCIHSNVLPTIPVGLIILSAGSIQYFTRNF